MNDKLLIGAASAGHQVEGNNTNSDTWAQEYMTTGGYKEKSLDAADHYHTYREDIRKMAQAGLNAYWSMIDNYEWQSGYGMKFGLMSLNRETQEHTPKESLYVLGKFTR